MLESYILPLINGRYIDRVDSKIDRRSYIFFPVSNAKLNKLFDSEKANNLIYFNEVDGQDKEQQSSIYLPLYHHHLIIIALAITTTAGTTIQTIQLLLL